MELPKCVFKMHQEDLCGSFISLDARMVLALLPQILALLPPTSRPRELLDLSGQRFSQQLHRSAVRPHQTGMAPSSPKRH